jgi:hypothetical protein
MMQKLSNTNYAHNDSCPQQRAITLEKMGKRMNKGIAMAFVGSKRSGHYEYEKSKEKSHQCVSY